MWEDIWGAAKTGKSRQGLDDQDDFLGGANFDDIWNAETKKGLGKATKDIGEDHDFLKQIAHCTSGRSVLFDSSVYAFKVNSARFNSLHNHRVLI